MVYAMILRYIRICVRLVVKHLFKHGNISLKANRSYEETVYLLMLQKISLNYKMNKTK